MAKVKQATIVKLPFWQDDRKMAWLFFGFAFLLYAQTIGFDYALDDVAVIRKNLFVQDGFHGISKILSTFYWAGDPDFANANAGLFRPISMVMFAVEWQLFHDSPHVFHFVNVLLYALVAYQLYRLLRQLFENQSITFSILVCSLWIALPIHVEVVANIKSADELLSVLFFLLSFRKLLGWSEDGQIKSILISAGWMFLALLSKEGAALFIPAMFIGLILFREKTIKQLIQPILFFVGIGIVWIGWHSWVIGNASTEMITYDYRNNALLSCPSSLDRIGTAVGMQARYWLKMLVGYPLSYDYSFNEIPVDGFGSLWSIVSLVGIAGSIFVCVKYFRTLPVVVFGILFYFISFALTSNIFYLIGTTFAERLTFAPSIGFAIIISWLILKLTKGLEVKKIHSQAVYILLPLLLIYSIRSFSRSQDWEYESYLYSNDAEHATGSARTHYNHGVLLLGNSTDATDEIQKKQFLDEAYNEFITAVTIDSKDFQSCYNLGVVAYRRKNYLESIQWSKKVLEINALDNSVLTNLGDAYRAAEKRDSAIICYKAAIDKNSATVDTWMNLGYTELVEKDTSAALEAFEGAVKLNPKYSIGFDKIANVCGMSRQFERSTKAFNEMLKLNPNDPKPYYMIRANFLALGDTTSALKYYQEYLNHGGK